MNPKLKSIDIVLERLDGATEPLPVEKQKALSAWLKRYLEVHDEVLLTNAFIKVIPENMQGVLSLEQKQLL